MLFGKSIVGRENMTHNDIWHAIDMFAHEHGLSCSGLARFSGLDPTIFNKSKRLSIYGQERWPTMSSIAKILNATHSRPCDFFKFMNDDSPNDTNSPERNK